MQVDDEFLQKMVNMSETLLTMTRDKLVWQSLAVPLLGEGWQQKFESARNDPYFLGKGELQLAEIRQMRDAAVEMLDQLRRGDPIRSRIDRIN